MDSRRIASIDGLRTIAIFAVVAFHYCYRWGPPLNSESLYPYGTALAGLPGVRFGGCGVQLFFVISGFVIAMTLDRRKTPREFVVRRYARLAPAMLLFERHDSDEYKRAGHCGRSPGTSLERDFQSVGPPAMANTRRRGY